MTEIENYREIEMENYLMLSVNKKVNPGHVFLRCVFSDSYSGAAAHVARQIEGVKTDLDIEREVANMALTKDGDELYNVYGTQWQKDNI